MQILRGHDTEISCLDWMVFKLPPVTAKKSVKNQKKRNRPRPVADTSDLFDIYSFDHLDDEFGTMIDKKVKVPYNTNIDDTIIDESTIAETSPTIQNNEKFNFIEACQSLKDDILLGTKSTTNNINIEVKSNDIIIAKQANNSNSNDSSCISNESDNNNGAVGGDDLLHEFEEINESFDETDTDDDDDRHDNNIVECQEKFCVASSGISDSHICLWDVKAGIGMQQIKVKTTIFKGKFKRPYFFNTFCWLNDSMMGILPKFGEFFVSTVLWKGENK